MRLYCTLFDVNYLPNFLVLYNSLIEQSDDLEIYAFCMDDISFDYLNKNREIFEPYINPVSLAELMSEFSVLFKIKQERSLVEFYFTCSPFIATYVMQRNSSVDHVTYLDADLLFFDSPEKIFQELGNYSVGIIAHKFHGWGKRFVKYGIYNVGWVTFKNDEIGKACLNSWKNKCEEWCFDYYDEEYERFGDQKYLDTWEKEFKNVKVIEQKGANLAPWNAGNYNVQVKANGKLYVDEDPLVFYHFASFRKVNANVYTTNLSLYLSRPSMTLKERIYTYYLSLLSNYATLINNDIVNVEILKKNRGTVQMSFRGKVNKIINSIIRSYFNDFIYKN